MFVCYRFNSFIFLFITVFNILAVLEDYCEKYVVAYLQILAGILSVIMLCLNKIQLFDIEIWIALVLFILLSIPTRGIADTWVFGINMLNALALNIHPIDVLLSIFVAYLFQFIIQIAKAITISVRNKTNVIKEYKNKVPIAFMPAIYIAFYIILLFCSYGYDLFTIITVFE